MWLNNVCVFCWVSQADSGFFCEGYSSDDDDIVKEEFRGNIIKQGCLLKQVRVEWKKVESTETEKYLIEKPSNHSSSYVGI